MMNGYASELIEANCGLPQRFIDDWKKALQMSAGRDLRHHAAEAGVQVGLRRDHVGQHGRLVGEDGSGGFVAGGFDAEEEGGGHCFISRHLRARRSAASGKFRRISLRTCLAIATALRASVNGTSGVPGYRKTVA
jgi:hypothetical protein